MPNIKSAKKREKQNIVKSKANDVHKKSVKQYIKKASRISTNDKDSANNLVSEAYSAIDKASKKIMHKNKAARLKSRITKLVKNAQ